MEPRGRQHQIPRSADGRHLYYRPEGQSRIERIRVEDGRVERVAGSEGFNEEGWWFSVDPDGRLVRQRTLTTSDIYGWDLKRP